MLISLCTPDMGRTHDLRQVMPSRLKAAAKSPPVEIVIVDYNSRDGLEEYVLNELVMPEGVKLTYRKYSGRDTWHMAHAFNLAAMASSGEYFWLMGCDVFLAENAVEHVRLLIDMRQDDFMYARAHPGVIVCRKDKFIEAGGYDERFEFYGPEGEELEDRLLRRGLKLGYYSNQMISWLQTERWEKVKNYRIKDHMTNMSRMMRPIYEENRRNGVMVANAGKEWGAWK